MAVKILSQEILNEAHRMALQSHTWNRGHSKDGRKQFWVIPSRTEEGVAHWVTSYGCTCKGARRNGDCAHQEAVRMHEAREKATRRPSYDDLMDAHLVDAF